MSFNFISLEYHCIYTDCVLSLLLGVMTSLQQPISGKVSTSLAGIQPILLTDISNSSTINPSNLTVSISSSSSSTSSSSDVKVELNSSLAANFGISTAVTSSLNSSVANTGMNNGTLTSGLNMGMSTGLNTGINTGMNPGISAGPISGVSSTSTFPVPQSRLTVSMNPSMSSGMNLPGMNPPIHSGMNSGGLNTVMNTGMSSGMGPGMNPGLGMTPMGMNSTNQIPPVPSGNLTSMQPDIYSTPAGVGGTAGPSMMNPQAQQTQVINFNQV